MGRHKRPIQPGEFREVGKTVYVGLRVYVPAKLQPVGCKGLNIRAYGFTPQEVHDIIVKALTAARDENIRLNDARKMLEGKQ